ncbi:MAG TPA: hypothetical protein RMH85_04135 [Polyangiaceae bacterium LLY-WYZ-15_(1-7)]|nr:hypothetical protein [Polyangiaceae bacterium LLY-WYZ-15_(1-7)]HJL03921.1 hypothetical protein [Polyangiaceae bacterium LLY-WYZ-15_(1-7)]HJL07657.1 hypothetical protein [Polyangiaceae bacterium LLY-WYZ-15_(1-7)]HJL32973.1 hypothetical protein [Polyangiaceae bacterium LLY-WYZ-15_(1-7)]HJL38332.1 hypothetical protein [Polyangiaceae bacterium LLY-WYZ-15_(1-7)]
MDATGGVMSEGTREDVSDAELEDLGRRVRQAQRRNTIVKLVGVVLVIGLFVGGLFLRSYGAEIADPGERNAFKGAQWLGAMVGLVVAGFLLKKYEIDVNAIE